MTDIEILLAVRGLIHEPERWFKGGIARAEDDRKVSIWHPHASKFSLDGAFYRVQHITKADCGPAYTLLKKTLYPQGDTLISNFNNARGTTHWAVLQLLDRTIIAAGGTPPQELQDE